MRTPRATITLLLLLAGSVLASAFPQNAQPTGDAAPASAMPQERPPAELPENLPTAALADLVVQHEGRLCPLDTLARDVLFQVTGGQTLAGRDAVTVLLAWTFEGTAWRDGQLIEIGDAELRAALELPAAQSAFSFHELVTHQPLREQIEALQSARAARTGLDPLQKEVSDILERLNVLNEVFARQTILAVPDPESVLAPWRSIDAVTAGESPALDAVRQSWQQLDAAFTHRDAAALAAVAGELKGRLAALPAAARPSAAEIQRELRYNTLKPFRVAWWLAAAGFGVLLLATAVLARQRRAARALDTVALLSFGGGVGVALYGLWLRGVLADRLPAANMYESLLFLGSGAAAVAVLATLLVVWRHQGRPVALTAGGMGALTLLLTDRLPLDPFIRPIAPVLLDTAWMAIHVPVIMISYAVLAIAVAVAHVQLLTMALLPQRATLARQLDRVHYIYAFSGALLLLVGIITGSMWGAASWGRYWGWDPKEVWSLVAFLGYMVILHVRIDRQQVHPATRAAGAAIGLATLLLVGVTLQPGAVGWATLGAVAVTGLVFLLADGMFATAVKSILAFWLIIMTYVGVNYVLGVGLHSYGFGTGPVLSWMYFLGGLDLALVAGAAVVYLLRRAPAATAAPPPAPAVS